MPIKRTKALPAQHIFKDKGSIDFGELGELLGYRLRRAQLAMYRDYRSSLAGLDLTQKQTAIMWLLSNNPGVSQVALAKALDMDRPSMMALTDRLQQRGLLTRGQSTVDRRRQELHLTREGIRLLAQAKRRIARHEQRIRSRFSADEFAALLAALQRFQS